MTPTTSRRAPCGGAGSPPRIPRGAPGATGRSARLHHLRTTLAAPNPGGFGGDGGARRRGGAGGPAAAK